MKRQRLLPGLANPEACATVMPWPTYQDFLAATTKSGVSSIPDGCSTRSALHAAGKLPADYVANLGDAQFAILDGRCCRFLGVNYADVRDRIAQ